MTIRKAVEARDDKIKLPVRLRSLSSSLVTISCDFAMRDVSLLLELLLVIQNSRGKPGCTSDLPWGNSLLLAVAFSPDGTANTFFRNIIVVIENEPPVRVYEQRSSPLKVGFVQPEVIVQPVVRGRLFKLLDEERL